MASTTSKRGKQATEESKAKRIAKLRATSPDTSGRDIALANPDRHLTEKMRLFVKFWAEGETILSASHRAGYTDSGTYCYRLAKDPAILKLYHAEKAKYEEACQMTRKRVMDGLLEGIEMAKTMAEPGNVIAGWREVGKMCGYYEPTKREIQINVKGDVTMKHLTKMSDAELLKLVKGEVTDVAFTEVTSDDEDDDS